jgi:hypothetical protein
VNHRAEYTRGQGALTITLDVLSAVGRVVWVIFVFLMIWMVLGTLLNVITGSKGKMDPWSFLSS